MKKLQTRIVPDMNRYTENFFLGMSPRQTVFSLCGAAVTAITYIVLAVPGIAALALGLPLFAAAFLRPEGLPLEKYLGCLLGAARHPAQRPYIREDEAALFFFGSSMPGRLKEEKEDIQKKRKKEQCPEVHPH